MNKALVFGVSGVLCAIVCSFPVAYKSFAGDAIEDGWNQAGYYTTSEKMGITALDRSDLRTANENKNSLTYKFVTRSRIPKQAGTPPASDETMEKVASNDCNYSHLTKYLPPVQGKQGTALEAEDFGCFNEFSARKQYFAEKGYTYFVNGKQVSQDEYEVRLALFKANHSDLFYCIQDGEKELLNRLNGKPADLENNCGSHNNIHEFVATNLDKPIFGSAPDDSVKASGTAGFGH
jgi:hypothetical protein